MRNFTLVFLISFMVGVVNAQDFELKLEQTSNNLFELKATETSGTGTPGTSNQITDFAVSICNSTIGVNITLVSSDFELISGGPVQTINGKQVHSFAAFNTPFTVPSNWVQNQWETIATFSITQPGPVGALDTFFVAGNGFSTTTSPNINIDLVDYTPTIDGELEMPIGPVPVTTDLTFYFDTVYAVNGTTASLDLKVKGFTDIESFQFVIKITDGNVASLYAVSSDVLPSSAYTVDVEDGTITMVWFDSQGQGVSYADETTLLSLSLLAEAEDTDSTTIVFTNGGNLQQEVTQNGQVVNPLYIEGLFIVSPAISITGTALSVNENPVNGVEAVLVDVDTFITETDGIITFNSLVPGSYVLKGAKSGTAVNGENSFDLYLIQKYIQGVLDLPNASSYLAADVNSSGTVTAQDLFLIKQRILDIISTYPAGMNYIVLNELPDSLNPFETVDSVAFTNLTSDTTQNLYVIKLGDVNHSFNTLYLGKGGEYISVGSPSLNFEVDESNQYIIVPITLNDLEGDDTFVGLQFTLVFDYENISFEAIESYLLDGLSESDFNLTQTDDGKLAFVWFGNEPTTLEEGESIFELKFKVLDPNAENINFSIDVNSTITEAMAFTSVGAELNINSMPTDININQTTEITVIEDSQLFFASNQMGILTIKAENLNFSQTTELKIISVDGKVVVNTGMYDNVLNIDATTWAKSIYFVELFDPKANILYLCKVSL